MENSLLTRKHISCGDLKQRNKAGVVYSCHRLEILVLV